MDLSQDRVGLSPRWRVAVRSRPQGRHARGLALGGEPAAFRAVRACPPAGEGVSLPGERSCPDGLLANARQFITLFYRENRLGLPDRRLWHVRHEIEERGTYWHTPRELAFGARVAWRDSSPGIERLDWRNLRVRDRREVASAPEVADQAAKHLHEATNGGRVRPVITVFAPDAPGRPGPRIVNPELIGYAGHQAADGAVTGDPAHTELTRLAREVGWPGARPASRFDRLPLLVQEAGGPITAHEISADAVLEVPISHPGFGWFAGLGLRWYAVPVVSDRYLDIGGVRYPAALFNGWRLGAKSASWALSDPGRYGQLPVIAGHLGLPVDGARAGWQDAALAELNFAVRHSFATARVVAEVIGA